jgi:hypothetical protein
VNAAQRGRRAFGRRRILMLLCSCHPYS